MTAARMRLRWADLGDDDLLTREQVGALLGMSGRHVARLDVPEIRLGRRCVRYRVGAVRAWLRTLEATAPA
jgi:predicted DNA-binding transcriptional regulator AlpA